MFVKGLFIEELLSNVADIDADILGVVQWSLEVKVSDLKGVSFGALEREDTADYDFENINRCSFGSHIAWVFDAVTTNRDASAIGILFFGAECAHNFGVCNLFPAVLGDVVIANEI